MKRRIGLGFWCFIWLAFSGSPADNFDDSMVYDLEHGPVKYGVARRNAVEDLRLRLAQGEGLSFDADRGYLPALLKALRVPESSQTLVYSKTSLQAQRIFPANPRALYFNGSVYVGYVGGGDVVEISVADPDLGAVFYVVEQEKMRWPKLQRRDDCLQCHQSPRTAGVPGHLLRSVGTDGNGFLQSLESSLVTDQRSPLAERWGGWYVSGNLGTISHRGKVAAGRESDVVAHLVLAHQVMAHNYLTRLNYETRAALDLHQVMMSMDRTPGGVWSESTRSRVRRAVEATVRCLTFADEALLPGRVVGSGSFFKDFVAAGVKDAKGRSLRDLDLEQRVFRYPLSFVLQEPEVLSGLLPVVREQLLARLRETLLSEEMRSRRGREAWELFAGVLAAR
jgi:hypothetical protein